MDCSGCGAQLAEEAKFCSECGRAKFAEIEILEPYSKKEAVARVGKDAATSALQLAKFVSDTAKEGVRSEVGKSMAMGALAVAAIAAPLPFVGSALGASVGAIIGAWRKF